ncbi:hypothetical protein BH11MYX3_BH11MYX3_38450 [soil metagenome]
MDGSIERTELATFCCVQCRLLQPPTTTCAECAAPMTATVELVRELLYYRDMRFNNHRDWGMLTAFLAGSSLALPILAPFAVGSMVALGVYKLRGEQRKRTIVGVEPPIFAPPPNAITLQGIARRFRSTITSIFDEAQVLLQHAVIKDRKGAVLLRRSEAAPFLLEVEGKGNVLVTGVARVVMASVLAEKQTVKRGDPRLHRMGVPDDLAVAGELQVASIAVDGQHVAATGVIEDEAVAELAFHRDGGRIPVMRGITGAPVLVSDRRMIAAAL